VQELAADEAIDVGKYAALNADNVVLQRDISQEGIAQVAMN